MPILEFFIPSNRKYKSGMPAPMDGMNELVAAERAGYGNSKKKKNGEHVEEICRSAIGEHGWETPTCASVVTLTFVEPHDRRDPDNVYGGAKFILDGITRPRGKKAFGAGAIDDDSQRCIKLRFGEILIDRESPGCWVRIETTEE